MMDALITCFVEDFRYKLSMNEYDDVDRTGGFEHISVGDGNYFVKAFTDVILLKIFLLGCPYVQTCADVLNSL